MDQQRLRGPLLLILMALLGITSLTSALPCRAQEVWFAPTDHLPRRGHVYSADYMDLFKPDAPWKRAASRIDVFLMTPLFSIRATDEEMLQLLSFLKEHKIALALNMGLVANERSEPCGHCEGYINPDEADRIVRRLKSLGANPKYLIGDEPLFWGHTFKKGFRGTGCQLSIEELAQRVAIIVNKVVTVFPDIKIVTAEPVPGDSLGELQQWLGVFHKATGRRIEAIQDDMNWNDPKWPTQVEQLRTMLTRDNVKFGVIYDSKGQQPTDKEAIESTKENIRLYEDTFPSRHDQIIFANWLFHPSHVLPETDTTSHTYIIDWYFDRAKRPEWMKTFQRPNAEEAK